MVGGRSIIMVNPCVVRIHYKFNHTTNQGIFLNLGENVGKMA
ncbi:hypothetical protein [Moraxella lacunata]